MADACFRQPWRGQLWYCNWTWLTKKWKVISCLTNYYTSSGSLLNAAVKYIYIFQANHGGVRGKLPKDLEEEEAMEATADLEDSSDELVATPDDEVKRNSDM